MKKKKSLGAKPAKENSKENKVDKQEDSANKEDDSNSDEQFIRLGSVLP